MTNPVLVQIDDWQVLYINGKKYIEAHRIDIRDIVEACGFNLEIRSLDGTDFEEQVKWDGVPDLLEEVPSG